jgi:RNA-directed DNA polymerase
MAAGKANGPVAANLWKCPVRLIRPVSHGERGLASRDREVIASAILDPVQLVAAASMPIKRHIKVKGEANPYDPTWEPYFEERLGVKMAGSPVGRWTLRLLWKDQGGICPVCNQKITTVTGWHNHHILWRTHGGKDTIENRVLVHPTCHQQIHSQGLDVGKPRPARGV